MKKKKKYVKKEKIVKPKIFSFNVITTLISLLISIISLYVALLVRSDTFELSKLTDKPLYYTIKIYPDEYEKDAQVSDKYVSMHLKLIVDDFKLKNKNFWNLNYNAVITRIKYFMVYDYNIENKDYKYMRYELEDRSAAKMTYEDSLYTVVSKLNYSLTPNKKFCYVLIYTETNSKSNLDLVFFRYHDEGDNFYLDTIIDDDNVLIDTDIINKDTVICKDYFIDLWGENDSILEEDINFMYDVYDDLNKKLIMEV